jgi:plastocyanin
MRGIRWTAVALTVAISYVPTTTMAAPIVIKARTVENGWVWRPKTVHVTAPKRVKWKNPTNEPHSVRFYKGPLKGIRFLLLEDEARQKKIKKAGKYKYRCDIPGHSKLKDGKCIGMCGKVVAH